MYRRLNNRSKAFICVETGEMFRTLTEGSEILKIHRTAIHHVLRGLTKSTKGYTFVYIQENIVEGDRVFEWDLEDKSYYYHKHWEAFVTKYMTDLFALCHGNQSMMAEKSNMNRNTLRKCLKIAKLLEGDVLGTKNRFTYTVEKTSIGVEGLKNE